MTDRWVVLFVSFLVAVLATPIVLADEYPRPEPRIESAIDRLIADVAALRTASAVTDCALYALVDEHLRPEFGLFRSGRAMLIEYWPEDDPDMQEQFVTAFYDYLVAKYGDLLVHFNSRTLQIIPLDEAPEDDRTSLGAVLAMNDGEEVDVSLTMRFIDDEWRIVDVVSRRSAEGVYSHASGYSDLFRDEIFDVGFEGLIEWLEKEAAPRTRCG